MILVMMLMIMMMMIIDRLVIFTVNQDIGLSAGNQLCGNLTGQHGEMPGQVVTTTLGVGHWVRVPVTAAVTIHNVPQCTWTWTR